VVDFSNRAIFEIDQAITFENFHGYFQAFSLKSRKMMMGFEKANQEQEKHGGKSVYWKKMR